ncbi:winged helix-turn-helix domain-containing protein [Burkholderia sp. LMG 21824]|uniref:winged helix-turn-helix domain-containing protein n=1 Tax=Burkholderia sp. LMG 21824 TaxID=3158172 RepID=UPI003C301537
MRSDAVPFAIWTRPTVWELIWQRSGRTLSLSGVGMYLAQCDFTLQKPFNQAYEHRR